MSSALGHGVVPGSSTWAAWQDLNIYFQSCGSESVARSPADIAVRHQPAGHWPLARRSGPTTHHGLPCDRTVWPRGAHNLIPPYPHTPALPAQVMTEGHPEGSTVAGFISTNAAIHRAAGGQLSIRQ